MIYKVQYFNSRSRAFSSTMFEAVSNKRAVELASTSKKPKGAGSPVVISRPSAPVVGASWKTVHRWKANVAA